MGALTGAEGAVGWIVAWIPFYSEIKLGIMLWMVAPQTEVSDGFLIVSLGGGKQERTDGDELLNEGKEGRATYLLSLPPLKSSTRSSFGFLSR